MKAVILLIIISLLINSCFTITAAQRPKESSPYPVFNHVYLAVHNMDSSLRFYTTAFDLKVTDHFNLLEINQTDTAFKRQVNVVFLKFSNQDFVFELAERADKTDTASRAGNLFQHVGVEVTDIETAFQRVVNAGGKVFIPIRRVRTNSGLEIKQAYIKGPDGETIELTEIVSGGY